MQLSENIMHKATDQDIKSIMPEIRIFSIIRILLCTCVCICVCGVLAWVVHLVFVVMYNYTVMPNGHDCRVDIIIIGSAYFIMQISMWLTNTQVIKAMHAQCWCTVVSWLLLSINAHLQFCGDYIVCALISVRFNVCSFCGLAAIRKSFIYKNLDIIGYAQNNGQHLQVQNCKICKYEKSVKYIPCEN